MHRATCCIEATYENGVFVPAVPPQLPERARVRLVIEPIDQGAAPGQSVAARRGRRISLDPEVARHIAAAPELAADEW